MSGGHRELVEAVRLIETVVLFHSWSDHNKFVAAHSCNVIVAAIHFIQASSEIFEQIVAFKVAIEIIDLLEIVEVADHYCQRSSSAPAAGDAPARIYFK